MEILNQDCDFIKVSSPILFDALSPDPTTYDSITVSAIINCCSDPVTKEITDMETAEYKIVGSDLYLKPLFFGRETFMDGVYSIKLTIVDGEDTAIDDNCYFVDCSFKCKFSDKIESLMSSGVSLEKQQALEFTMLHYALTTASNCGCNCNDLCNLYKQLYKVTYGENLIISNNNSTSQFSDCGCN